MNLMSSSPDDHPTLVPFSDTITNQDHDVIGPINDDHNKNHGSTVQPSMHQNSSDNFMEKLRSVYKHAEKKEAQRLALTSQIDTTSPQPTPLLSTLPNLHINTNSLDVGSSLISTQQRLRAISPTSASANTTPRLHSPTRIEPLTMVPTNIDDHPIRTSINNGSVNTGGNVVGSLNSASQDDSVGSSRGSSDLRPFQNSPFQTEPQHGSNSGRSNRTNSQPQHTLVVSNSDEKMLKRAIYTMTKTLHSLIYQQTTWCWEISFHEAKSTEPSPSASQGIEGRALRLLQYEQLSTLSLSFNIVLALMTIGFLPLFCYYAHEVFHDISGYSSNNVEQIESIIRKQLHVYTTMGLILVILIVVIGWLITIIHQAKWPELSQITKSERKVSWCNKVLEIMPWRSMSRVSSSVLPVNDPNNGKNDIEAGKETLHSSVRPQVHTALPSPRSQRSTGQGLIRGESRSGSQQFNHITHGLEVMPQLPQNTLDRMDGHRNVENVEKEKDHVESKGCFSVTYRQILASLSKSISLQRYYRLRITYFVLIQSLVILYLICNMVLQLTLYRHRQSLCMLLNDGVSSKSIGVLALLNDGYLAPFVLVSVNSVLFSSNCVSNANVASSLLMFTLLSAISSLMIPYWLYSRVIPDVPITIVWISMFLTTIILIVGLSFEMNDFMKMAEKVQCWLCLAAIMCGAITFTIDAQMQRLQRWALLIQCMRHKAKKTRNSSSNHIGAPRNRHEDVDAFGDDDEDGHQSHDTKSLEPLSFDVKNLLSNFASNLKMPLSSFLTGIDYIQLALDECKEAVSNVGGVLLLNNFDSIQTCINNIKNTHTLMLMEVNRCVDISHQAKALPLHPHYESIDLEECLMLPIQCMKSMQSRIDVTVVNGVSSSSSASASGIVPSDVCAYVITDKQWLQDNVLCLLSNAIKYSCPEVGSVRVSMSLVDYAIEELIHDHPDGVLSGFLGDDESYVSFQSHEFGNRSPMKSRQMSGMGSAAPDQKQTTPFLRVEVEDTGISLSDEAMGSLFNPLKQIQRLTGGTGLGLFSLAKRLEALHGFYGVMKRRDGKQGSLFWFAIPYKPDTVYANQMNRGRLVRYDDIAFTDSILNNYHKVMRHAPPLLSVPLIPTLTQPKRSNHHNGPHHPVFNHHHSPSAVVPTSLLPSSEHNRDAIKPPEDQLNSSDMLKSPSLSDAVQVSLQATSEEGHVTPSKLNEDIRASTSRDLSDPPSPSPSQSQLQMTSVVLGTAIATAAALQSSRQASTSSKIRTGGKEKPSNADMTPSEADASLLQALTKWSRANVENDVKDGKDAKPSDSNEPDPSQNNGRKPLSIPDGLNPDAEQLHQDVGIVVESNVSVLSASTLHDKSLTILVVDDSPTIVKMTTVMLKRLGHKVHSVENGAIAVRMIEERWRSTQTIFEVIFMDLQMPVMDGLEATRRIRTMESQEINKHMTNNALIAEEEDDLLVVIGGDSTKGYGSNGSGSGKATAQELFLAPVAAAAHTVSLAVGTVTGTSRNASSNGNKKKRSFGSQHRHHFPQRRRHIIIGMSANSDSSTTGQAYLAGVDAFLSKPLNIDNIQRILEESLHPGQHQPSHHR